MADIERLKLLKRGVGVGNSIAQIAKMDTEALQALVMPAAAQPHPPDFSPSSNVSTETYVEMAMEAMLRLDAPALGQTLDRAAVALPRLAMMNQVILPLLEKIGRWWADGRLKVVNEHLGSVVLRQFLGEALRSVDVEPAAPVIVTATPTGQWHEFGAMITAVLAMEVGWQALYCGANLPAEEVASAALEKNAMAVALSVVQPTDVYPMTKEIQRLMRLLPPRCRLIVGGRFASSLTEHFPSSSPTFVFNMQSFQMFLQELATFQSI
jgi:methanogenic corrinoid protein MtbC1